MDSELGSGAAVSGDHIYVYDCRSDDPGERGYGCVVARVTFDDVASAAAYEYWTGRWWSARRHGLDDAPWIDPIVRIASTGVVLDR